MSVTPPLVHPIRWHCGRAVLLHLALVTALPLCAVAAWWQVDRALAGNALSWLYVFEWPAFGALSVWFWWVMLTAPSRSPQQGANGGATAPATSTSGHDAGGVELMARRSAAPRWEAASESEPLRAYNSYLRQLADLASGAPVPRRPRAEAR